MEKPRGLLLVMMDSDPAHDEDFNGWYDTEHIPERLSIPGFISARRFDAVEGSPRFLCLYELESPDVLDTPEYKYHIENPTPWSLRTHTYRIETIRNVYQERTIRP